MLLLQERLASGAATSCSGRPLCSSRLGSDSSKRSLIGQRQRSQAVRAGEKTSSSLGAAQQRPLLTTQRYQPWPSRQHHWQPAPRRAPPPARFNEVEVEPETEEEMLAQWAGEPDSDGSFFLPGDNLDQVTEALFEEDITPEYFVQNFVAVALLAVLAVSSAFILGRLVVVTYSLVSAAVRYSFVAVLVALLCVFFF